MRTLILDLAADQAPDAPADNRSRGAPPPAHPAPAPPIPSRDAILDVARQAIEHTLARS